MSADSSDANLKAQILQLKIEIAALRRNVGSRDRKINAQRKVLNWHQKNGAASPSDFSKQGDVIKITWGGQDWVPYNTLRFRSEQSAVWEKWYFPVRQILGELVNVLIILEDPQGSSVDQLSYATLRLHSLLERVENVLGTHFKLGRQSKPLS